jgi:hypothetical protein
VSIGIFAALVVAALWVAHREGWSTPLVPLVALPYWTLVTAVWRHRGPYLPGHRRLAPPGALSAGPARQLRQTATPRKVAVEFRRRGVVAVLPNDQRQVAHVIVHLAPELTGKAARWNAQQAPKDEDARPPWRSGILRSVREKYVNLGQAPANIAGLGDRTESGGLTCRRIGVVEEETGDPGVKADEFRRASGAHRLDRAGYIHRPVAEGDVSVEDGRAVGGMEMHGPIAASRPGDLN